MWNAEGTREQMVTTGDRAGPEARSQLEISMVFIFIFPYVPIGITTDENPKWEGALFCLVTFWLDVDLVSAWDNSAYYKLHIPSI